MKSSQLGQEITRLRLECGLTLRRLAARLEVSAAHLSDIERNHRRPSEKLLRKIAHELSDAGATFDSLEEFVTGVDVETRRWVAATPGLRKFLRIVRASGVSPHELTTALEKVLGSGKAVRSKKSSRIRKVAG